ncbi:DUF4238 domain-containing protein [Achromobacter mucicolens]|uniref:DUF4238 domain-containing protein n=1 Tax=Achromobacter mucicolens TaxID=1389922 RepID=UPI0020A4BF33|nr:DUF4238 domain-containing protein [Achromobacter mucicolens]MCP2515544.1 DUF4238 domain-containing protein [Achromobacter mucicolens]
MSGRIQHHIPQSFQRGFLICAKSKQTYVYRVDKHYVSNIDRIAAQRDFYSKPSSDGRKTLDDIITSYEDRLGHLLGTLRAIEMGAAADASMAAEVIAHLTPRGNSVRRMFGSGAMNLMVGVSEIFADKETIVSLLGLGEAAPNITWNEHIASALDKEEKLTQAIRLFLSQTKIPKASLDRMIFMFAKENMLGDTNPIPDQFQQAFSGMFSRIDEIVSDSHKKLLNNGLIAEPRKQDLEEFTWNICPAPEDGAIMPDCIALGLDEEEGGFLPYIMTSTASVVVMPLTSRKLLVGVRAGSTVPDLSSFNHEASECSDEIFIAASSAHVDLSEKIGKRWKGKMDSVVQEALSSLLAHRNPQSKTIPALAPTPFSGYQLTFIGWSTEEDVSHISGAVQSLVEKLRQWLDLTHLDGITFTSDFGKTLTDTERGFGANTNPEGIPDYIAQGAAALLVLQDGKLKVRIVLNKEYAMSLVGEEMQDAGVTLHLLVAGLSLAHTVNQFESRLPGFLMEPVTENQHDAVLHCAMRKALRAYRYAYDSAGFGVEDLFEQEFSRYLTQTVDLTYARIAKAKEEHAIDRDHPKLFNTAHAAVTDTLIASARLIGHLDGMGKAPLPTPETSAGAAIAARQLTGWVNAFAYDLLQFWKRESWTREDLYGLNIHVERLLWPCGIFLYPADSGQGTMILSLQAG